jgi:hypothetical protein
MQPARLLFALFASLVLQPASAETEITACVVASLEGNTSYYGAATTATKLQCEFAEPNEFPTLAALYAAGWRLLEVIGGNHAIAMGHQGPSPLYLLERETGATAVGASEAAAAAD